MKRPASKPTFQDRLPLILSFFVPVLIMIGIFIQRKIYPFGDRCFLRTDLYHQYAPFMAEFLRKLRAGDALTWSWNIGLGSNFVSLFAYYLASPTNWLIYLCPADYVIEFITFWVVVKIGLSSLTFSYYLSRRYKTKSFGVVFFGTLYSLSAYMAAYSWNIMWLDCLFLAPLIILGLERLFKEDKCFLYCISLALAIISNYYISITICIFLVLYFIVLVFDKSLTAKGFLRRSFNFALYSLLAGCMAAVLLFPTVLYLGNTASAISITPELSEPIFSAFPKSWDELYSGIMKALDPFLSLFPQKLETYFSIFQMLARHMVNLETETGLEHWPNIYCGVAVFFLVPLYVMNKKIPYREKITRISLLFFLLISFSTNILNFIWHGFHFPNSLPCRQSFLYIAILLCLCFEAWLKIGFNTRGQIVGSFWGGLGLILLCQELVTEETFAFHHYLVTAIFMGIYALLLYLYRRKKCVPATLFIVALSFLVAESAMNTGITSVNTVNRNSYWENTDSIETLTEQAKKASGTFVRFEKFESLRKTKNDGVWANFPSASLFSSTANSNVTKLYKEWGMEGSTNAFGHRGATPLTSALLSVRYMFSTDSSHENSLYTLVSTEGNISMYECTYWLPLGFILPSDIDSKWDYTSGNDITMQNNFVRAATGISDVFSLHSNVSSVESTTVDVTTTGYYYAAVNNSSVDSIKVNYIPSANGNRKMPADHTFNDTHRAYILDIGWMEAGESFTLTATDSKKLNLSIVRLNEEKLAQAIDILSAESFIVDEYTSTSVTGHISTSGGLMYTSIPYEKGWEVYVDGVLTVPTTFADTMLAVPLAAGDHTIQLIYTPDGLKDGALISFVGLGCFLLLVLFSFMLYFADQKQSRSGSSEKVADLKINVDPVSTDKDVVPVYGEPVDSHLATSTSQEKVFEEIASEENATEENVSEENSSEENASEENISGENVSGENAADEKNSDTESVN